MDISGLRAGAVVNDIVYAPLTTELLRAARAADLIAVDGLGMLINQAALSFEAWFGVRPPIDDLLRQRLIVDLGEK
jgi:shikimate dehydrogenase